VAWIASRFILDLSRTINITDQTQATISQSKYALLKVEVTTPQYSKVTLVHNSQVA